MWQALRAELHPKGLEVVTVALDAGGIDAARQFIEAAKPEHPSLIDQAHRLDELFGVVNVPSGIWIDETGTIVRPPEPAFPGVSMFRELMKNVEPEQIQDEQLADMLRATRQIRPEPEKYVNALRDWVEQGADSRYALSPDEVIERSRPRPREHGLAAAHFELGQQLWGAGRTDAAIRNWREAHRLHPENWTYKRQAWSFADPFQKPTDLYESDWLSDVLKVGPENYYPALDM